MLKNIRNMAISKQLLISLIFATLMFSAFGMNMDHAYASDLNESVDELGVELDIGDKLENSQDNEILEETYSLNGGEFSDIQEMIDNAASGDVIKLKGTFVSTSSNDTIKINKPLTITSSSTATLDAKNLSSIFRLTSRAAGTISSNWKFKNGYNEMEGGAIRINAKSVTVENCVFEDNYAKLSAGALFTSYTPLAVENVVVRNCNFTNNGAGAAAGALGVFGYNFLIENCIFDSNTVKQYQNAYGGAVQVGLDTDISYGVLRNCKFINNRAISINGTSHGGAGCVRNGTHYYNCIFINNTADHGGALTYHSSGSLENCEFYNNSANKYGGAVSISLEHETMDLNISDCIFNGNEAPLGGAVRLSGMNIKIEDSNFTDNFASEYGGAVNIDAFDVNVENSNFNNNVANIDGGAVFINGKNTLIKHSSFIGNDAMPDADKLDDGLGGAIYVNSTQAVIENNVFRFNTARNGSAVYYDKSGEKLKLTDNIMQENQAWVYLLPVSAHDIYYGESEQIKSIIYGGNNIARYNDLSVSNAVYNAASNQNININGETPVSGATMNGHLYQDDREYNMDILLTVTHEDGSVVYNKTLKSSYLGEVSDVLNDLKPGKYYVKSTHFEDTYYKAIVNTTSFRVIPLVDNKILKSASDAEEFNYDDYVLWTLEITNNGPNNATDVVVRDLLPQGLEYVNDTSGGKYNRATGVLTIGNLAVGKTITVKILTKIKKTGEINNKANVTAKEHDTNLTNNKDDATIVVNPACDLEVKKSVNNSNPNYGDLVDWTIVVKNNGPDKATSIKVADILPDSLIYNGSSSNYNLNSGSWSIGTLNVGSSATFHIITKVNATGLIENNVSVSAKEHDRDMSNNFDKEDINVKPACDLAIVKRANVSSANFGDLVKWTLTVTNNGPDNATGVNVVDTLPKGFVYVKSILQRGSYSNGKITIGNLAVGERLTFDIITRVNATGTFTNVANVTGREYDYDLSNNKDTKSILIHPAADLQVTKVVNDTKPKYGKLITWTITVKNNGPNKATNVKVTDLLPKSVIWQNDDGRGKYDHESGQWNIGELAKGASASLNIVCKVNKTGLTINNVNVTGKEYDYDLTNNIDNETINVAPAADLVVKKVVNNTKPNYLDLVKWTVTISNNGPDNAHAVHVDEILPNGLILINHTASKGTYDNGVWTMSGLNKGEVQNLILICKVNKTGKIINLVEIHGDEYDPNLSNNDNNASINVPPSVDLELIKEINNTNPHYDEKIMWTIIIKNNGPDNATGVVVDDVLSSRLEFVGYESSRGTFSANKWNVGRLDVGCVEYLNITCIAKALGEISNYAEVNSNEYDWNEANNYDVATADVYPVADLAIEKLVDDSNPNYGDIIVWTLIVTNNGPNDASDVVVFDTLPDGLDFVESSSEDYDDGIWNIGYLNVGDSKRLEITCRVSQTGSFTNNASVFGTEKDLNLSNNYANESIDVAPASDISITKIASKYYYLIGETVRYAIEVVNNGPDRADNIEVKEIMDDSLSLKSFRASAGDFNKLTKTWDIDSLEYGESASLLIEAIATEEGVADNEVSASSDNYDPDLSNNDDFASVKVSKNFLKDSKTPKTSKDLVDNDVPKKVADKFLEKNVSGNSFFVLLLSLIFSIIFLGGNKSKRR